MKSTDIVRRTAFFLSVGILGFACSQNSGQADEESKEDGFFSWDTNSDQRVDGDEFSSAFEENDFYELWDRNKDGLLDESEWSEGLSAHYGDREFGGDFRVWDLNEDKYVDSEEYAQKTFELWDENQDGFIDAEEYGIWVAEDSSDGN